MILRFAFIFCLFLFGLPLTGQNNVDSGTKTNKQSRSEQNKSPKLEQTADTSELRLVQLTGIVLGSDSLDNLPYTTVFDKTSCRGTITDYYGYFALVARPGDTLIFRRLGYKTATYIVPKDIPVFGNALIQLMDVDTVYKKPVNVYPWPSKEEFASAFLNLKLENEDELRRAQRQLSGESLAQIALRVNSDAGLAYNALEQQRLSQLYMKGQIPVNNLLNPVAWMQFVDAWKKGKLARQ
jgi:hypothetical protein